MFLCIHTLRILKHMLQCRLFHLHAVNSLVKHVVAYSTLWPEAAARGRTTARSDMWFNHTVYTVKWNTARRSQGNPRSIIWINRVDPSNRRVEYNCDLHGLQTRKRKPKSGTPKSESSGGGGCGGTSSSSVQQTPSIVKVEQPGTVEKLRSKEHQQIKARPTRCNK